MIGNVGELVYSGDLVLALPIAFLAGLLAFLSPCVIPLVPGYIAYVSGFALSAEPTPAELALAEHARLAHALLVELGLEASAAVSGLATITSYGLLGHRASCSGNGGGYRVWSSASMFAARFATMFATMFAAGSPAVPTREAHREPVFTTRHHASNAPIFEGNG